MTLYAHQSKGGEFLAQRESAGLFWEMGTGKSRTALIAAKSLFGKKKIDRVLVFCPASVQYAWLEELAKLSAEGFNHNLLRYDTKLRSFFTESVGGNLNGKPGQHVPIAVVSYGLLQQERHVAAIEKWCASGKTALVCDESSFLKNRQAKQTKGTYGVAQACTHRWLLSGTPVCNGPLDLFAQGKVMAGGAGGPLARFRNFYHFAATYCVRGGFKMREWFPVQDRLPDLQKRFAPYVSRVEKKDCLDLPDKAYTVREVMLDPETWSVYQELKNEAMLALGDGGDKKPEPNAAVRLLRLCQLTSGHVGGGAQEFEAIQDESRAASAENEKFEHVLAKDVSSEKLDYLVESILTGELAAERALIVWCRWRRERERLCQMLLEKAADKIVICQIYGGQSAGKRAEDIEIFQSIVPLRRAMLAQQHAGGFGLNLTAASTAVYLSNDWSYSTRVQSEDRCHRIGQKSAVTYVDVLAVGPKGQQTVDHKVREALERKQSVAEWTVGAWRKALEEE